MGNTQSIDENILSEMQKYYDGGNSIAEVARKFNSTYNKLKGLNKKGLLKFRENNHCNQYCVKIPDKETLSLMQDYYNDLHSLRDLAEKFNISYTRLVTLGKKGVLNFDNSEERHNKLVRKKSIGRKHTEETKKKLSLIRKQWIAENPDKSPYLMSHKSRGETYPEKYFREWMEKENIPFQQEYKFKLYAFDFLVNERIDLEIDGGQHKNDKRIIEHDIRRDNKSKSAGFIVYRITWSDYQKLNQEEKSKFLLELKKFLLDESNPIPEFVIKKHTRPRKRKYEKKVKPTKYIKHKIDKRLYQYDYRALMSLELYKGGDTIEQICKTFCVKRSVVYGWIQSVADGWVKKKMDDNRVKHSSKATKKMVPIPQKQQAISLLKQGMSYVQVGKKFKVSDNAIRKWVKSLGLNPKYFGRDGKKNKIKFSS